MGDCYVAVTGLPQPRKDHALAMCRFAKECMYATWKVSRELSETFGPDTLDLTMRMGIHSGPVTAGVLRGEKSRFQLFGDTMNTTSRMESNGTKNRIQLSQETADLLVAAGKGSWIVPREDKITAKGKVRVTLNLPVLERSTLNEMCSNSTLLMQGELQTYWLNTDEKTEDALSVVQSTSGTSCSEGTSSKEDIGSGDS